MALSQRERNRRKYLRAIDTQYGVRSYLSKCRAMDRPVGKVEKFSRHDVIETYGDACFYCPKGLFEWLDHYVPIRHGGDHTLDNVRPSCARCNILKKDDMPPWGFFPAEDY